MNRSKQQKGFTQIELLIVIGIILIMGGIAAFSLARYQQQTAVRETVRSLDSDLIWSRNEARSRPQRISLTFTATGYTVFIDSDGDTVYNSGAGDTLLFQRTFVHQVQIVPPAAFFFTTTGEVNVSQQVVASRAAEPSRQYRVTIFLTGLTRVERSENGGATWVRAW
jgi:prepilin-type N-terminal cleavage/methylation domain-containing protein